MKKNRLNRLKILKNQPVRFRFRFYKPETEKTELNRKNQAKPEKTKPNQFEPGFVLKNRTETGRFKSVSVFFLKKKFRFDYFFFYKNQTENDHP